MTLTRNQLDVLRGIADGALYKNLAPALGIGRSTLDRRVAQLKKKFKVQTNTQMVIKAHKLGVLVVTETNRHD